MRTEEEFVSITNNMYKKTSNEQSPDFQILYLSPDVFLALLYKSLALLTVAGRTQELRGLTN